MYKVNLTNKFAKYSDPPPGVANPLIPGFLCIGGMHGVFILIYHGYYQHNTGCSYTCSQGVHAQTTATTTSKPVN